MDKKKKCELGSVIVALRKDKQTVLLFSLRLGFFFLRENGDEIKTATVNSSAGAHSMRCAHLCFIVLLF